MKISDFDYDLPKKRIAIYPPKVRGESRLMVVDRNSGKIENRKYGDLVEYLRDGDCLILNDTKVIKARLVVKNKQDKERELLVLEKHGEGSLNRALCRGRVEEGEVLIVGEDSVVVEKVLGDGVVKLRSEKSLYELARVYGEVPLPPYMKREAEKSDEKRYQTVFSKQEGSVAAPTASLNFTDGLEKKLLEKGVEIGFVTLHVGMGTFLPVREDEVEKHEMHREYFEVRSETLEMIRRTKKQRGRVVVVGTTVTRVLEYLGERVMVEEGNINEEADIFIYPGYTFEVVDMMLTNFHAPRSTVLLMATAFCRNELLKRAYEEAIEKEYMFLSYGDSMLIV